MKKIIAAIILVFLLGGLIFFKKPHKSEGEYLIPVSRGNLELNISAYGEVRPRNRLEIHPPFSGRIEEILVGEGDIVGEGSILAWMSSQDRAALIDIARSRGEAEVRRWEDVYKRAPVIAHLDGFIIHRGVQPGQSVGSGEAIFVMADQLIVQAQVDETDIGKIRKGSQAVIRLDAYPDIRIPGEIEHISYESRLVNNVVVYTLDIQPLEEFEFIRSGMSAEILITLEKSEDALILPISVIRGRPSDEYVLVSGSNSEPEKRSVVTGIRDGVNIEIKEGLSEGEMVVYSIGTLPAGRNFRRGGLPGMGG